MTEKELKFLSDNTRISLSHIDTPALLEQINEMFTFIKRIDSINLDNFEPFEHPLIDEVALREDIIQLSYTPEIILKNAPEIKNNSIVVPKVI